jgi:hypothetical protein
MSKRKSKKNDLHRVRNHLAVHAQFRSGAGSHGDKRKERSRKACRGKVAW